VRVSGSSVPEDLLTIRLDVEIAGRIFNQTFLPAPSQSYDFHFDGLDLAGRPLRGAQTANVRLCYGYPLEPVAVDSGFESAFGRGQSGPNSAPLTNPRSVPFYEASCRRWTEIVRLSPGSGVAGWDLDVNHRLDPVLLRTYKGNGERQGLDAVRKASSTTFAGNGLEVDLLAQAGLLETLTGPNILRIDNPSDLDVGPDGTLYVLDGPRVVMLTPSGLSRHVAGRFDTTLGDGSFTKPATQFDLRGASYLAVGPDGMIYVAGVSNACLSGSQVYRFSIDSERVERVAGVGDCNSGSPADGISALSATLASARGLAFGPDGALYVGEPHRVRRIGSDGVISTVAGTSTLNSGTDPNTAHLDVYGGVDTQPVRATEFAFGDKISDIAVGEAGELYVATGSTAFVVSSDGIIRTLAGGTTPSGNEDIYDPTHAPIGVDRLAVGPGGAVYVLEIDAADIALRKTYRVENGALVEVAASSQAPWQEGIVATQALLQPHSIAVHPDGRVLVGDTARRRVITLGPSFLIAGGYQVPSSDGQEVWEFDGSGKHLRTRDTTTGATLQRFSYDLNGRLTTVRDRDGNVTTIVRNAAGDPVQIVPPFAQPTTIVLDADGRASTIVGPDGATHGFTYKPGTLLLTSMTDANQQTYSFSYDADGKLMLDADPAGGFQQLLRTERPQGFDVIRTTPETSNATTYSQTQTLIGALHREVRQPDGTVSASDAFPDATQTLVDADGTTTSIILGPDPRWGMNAPVALETRTTLPSGLERTLSERRYATLNNPADLLSLKDLTLVEELQSDPPRVTTYDAATRVLKSVSPEGRQTLRTLDTLGHTVKYEVTGLEPMSFLYDVHGRLESVTVGSGSNARHTEFGYRLDGYLGSESGPMVGEQSIFTPDAAGRVIDLQRADGAHVASQFDGESNLRSLTPPGSAPHVLAYSALNFLQDYQPPQLDQSSNSTTHYSYDHDRRLVEVTRSDGQTMAYHYDPTTGQLAQISFPDANLDYTYAQGRVQVASRTDVLGTHLLSYAYDGRLRTGTTWSGEPPLTNGTVQRTYDDHFRTMGLIVNHSEVVRYGYDHDGLVTTAGPLEITRRPVNGIVTGTTLGAMATTRSADSFGDQSDMLASYAGAAVYEERVTARDARGRIRSRTEIVGTQIKEFTYSYDAAGRLSDVFLNGDQSAHYGYDSNGNRVARVSPVGTVVGRYDEQDRLTRYCSEDAMGAALPAAGLPCLSYSYGAAGELGSEEDLVTGTTTNFAYDAQGALKSVGLPDGRVIDYELDAAGRRIGKMVDGIRIFGLLYQDNLRPIAQLDANNSLSSIFVYATRKQVPDFIVRAGVTYRIVADHLGSVTLVVNANDGTIVQRIEYDEFGRVLSDSNPGFQPFGFAGGIYDPDTGLVRFGAREYDAAIGRWTAKDPTLFGGRQPNLYTYCRNDSINFEDPEGLGDLPGEWDNGVVFNNTNRPVLLFSDTNGAQWLGPLETSSRGQDIDFVIDDYNVTKVGPNDVRVDQDGSVHQFGPDMFPGHDPRPAIPADGVPPYLRPDPWEKKCRVM
jgi:RHS repeat-associated protein